ncbi:LysE family translocator [Microvirga solisilvae]|uniref:LysE family translocator n=1 Tax=Microvirga solisilvae TaxID=2919498 RepID=UPI001FAFD8A4|nr:LysE family translocator [Microvirga solisilvae]
MSAFYLYLPGILLAYSAFILATLSPGPALMATIGTSMGAGRKAGIMLGLGVVTGSMSWALLAAAGLSALLTAYAEAVNVLKIAGGLYLLWLAYKAFRSAASTRDLLTQTPDSPSRSATSYYLRGWAIHMTNPKAIFAWIAIISLGLQPGAPFWVAAAIITGTGLFALVFYCLCAIAFSTQPMIRAYGKARRWIDGVLGVFFTFAAYKLLSR